MDRVPFINPRNLTNDLQVLREKMENGYSTIILRPMGDADMENISNAIQKDNTSVTKLYIEEQESHLLNIPGQIFMTRFANRLVSLKNLTVVLHNVDRPLAPSFRTFLLEEAPMRLEELCLCNVLTRFHGDPIQQLCQALQETTTLLSLDLGEPTLTDNHVEQLCETLKTNFVLKRLGLRCGRFGVPGVVALTELLCENPSLELLDLSQCNRAATADESVDETAGVIAQILSRPVVTSSSSCGFSCSLRSLSLGGIGMNANGARAILQCSSLIYLDLAENLIFTDECLSAIWTTLGENTTLKTFRFGSEQLQIEDEQAELISAAIAKNTFLEFLEFSTTQCGDNQIAIILRALETNTTLTSLEISCLRGVTIDFLLTTVAENMENWKGIQQLHYIWKLLPFCSTQTLSLLAKKMQRNESLQDRAKCMDMAGRHWNKAQFNYYYQIRHYHSRIHREIVADRKRQPNERKLYIGLWPYILESIGQTNASNHHGAAVIFEYLCRDPAFLCGCAANRTKPASCCSSTWSRRLSVGLSRFKSLMPRRRKLKKVIYSLYAARLLLGYNRMSHSTPCTTTSKTDCHTTIHAPSSSAMQ